MNKPFRLHLATALAGVVMMVASVVSAADRHVLRTGTTVLSDSGGTGEVAWPSDFWTVFSNRVTAARSDWRGDYVFDDAAVATVAPKGVDSGTSRVKRGGGSYEHGRDYLRCAKRDASSPDSASRYNGFRLYCSIPVDP